MKKLLIVLLVLTMASAASAYTCGWRVAPGEEADHYMASDTITIQLYTDDPAITGIELPAIADDDDFGTAHNPLTLNANLVVFPQVGTIVNAGGPQNVLIEYVSGSANPGTPATGVLYEFEYHVPAKPASTIVKIGGLFSLGMEDYANYWEESVTNEGYETYGPADWDTYEMGIVEIHVIPEPATIALLGLGGLLLRRRK